MDATLKVCIYCNTNFTPPLRQPHSKRCSSKACLQAYKNEWGRKNPKCKTDWINKNPEKRKISSSAYRKKNKPYYAHYASLRVRHITQAMPKWVDKEEILDIYKEAQYMQMEVDHIVPIKHSRVCGLHVPWNMQLLTRSENAKKSNKFDEDIVGRFT